MTGSCPSDLRLERHLMDPSTSDLSSHLSACEACRARLARMEADGEAFRRFVYPATVDAVTEAAGRRRAPAWIAALAAAGAAGALAVVLIGRPSPAPEYVGTKGDAIGFTAWLGSAEGARPLRDGDPVPPGAALRFQVRATGACRLWIVSADAGGTVSRIYPAEGDQGAVAPEAGPLPGGAVLDGNVGPERLFAVCARAPLTFESLAGAVRSAIAGGETSLRAARAVSGLPEGTAQASLLLEKRP